MNRLLVCWLLGSVVVATGCTTTGAQVDFDPEMDFSDWRQYAWYPSEAPPTQHPGIDSPLFHTRVEQAIDRALSERGFERSGSEPDFHVRVHFSTEERLDVVELNRSYPGGPYGARRGGSAWGAGLPRETVGFEYEIGTLVIDLVDVERRQVVWRGSTSRRLAERVDPEIVTERVNAAVDEILASFPPPDER